ncbi:MAG: hypothetical protein II563_03045 [Treponema sp.]|nr:hypothetical protein [Treponema sp.]MBQ2551811.1 hypothetical protein [Treponema sp.]MBQ5382965.1 hypothetical protein [Treponema sp.]
MAEISVAIYAGSYVPSLIEKSVMSAVDQSLKSMEIILVDDCRTNAESKSLKSTFKRLLKSCELPYGKSLRLLSMGRTAGITDALRSAVQDSSSKYFSVLIMGDVFYSRTSLSDLLELSSKNASEDSAEIDVVQGSVIADKKDPEILKIDEKAYDIIEKNLPGEFEFENPEDLMKEYFLSGKYAVCIQGKLFLRSTLEDSLSRMPMSECFCAFEYMWMYFLLRKSHVLVSSTKKVCVRYMDSSPDSGDFKIDSPGRWSKICSASSAFTAIFFDLADNPTESGELGEYFRSVMSRYALSNVKSIERVDPTIRTVAEAILQESWGEELIAKCRLFLSGAQY